MIPIYFVMVGTDELGYGRLNEIINKHQYCTEELFKNGNVFDIYIF